ncbi:carbohydrate ABC transporter permease [[Clostridium] fimetarium]|uniref:sn-glycerol 3-phosphate transport system permease protein n=1 Tax=[Clostridium] fimetarium TaxID=99656 RepID=A0A1I0NRS1_9FIRM|nr:sugar ABC transporter permease [[Clostridium] fimetarium]SEW03606.1 sn-glycerol 3-phosphate transport system permease protein [[Clostridium] fimetarium]
MKKINYKKAGSLLKPYALITPSMIILFLFFLYPMIYMIYLSFFKWNMIGKMKFIGIKNYLEMFGNSEFWVVIKNTFSFMLLSVGISILLSLLLAAYLQKNTKINQILQSVIFAPYIISFVSISFIFLWMFEPDYGLFNYFLECIGLPPIRWLQNTNTAMISLVMVSVWKGVGYNTLIIISAIQKIPQYLFEAAQLDRSSRVKTFFKITLPMISPTMFFLVLVNIIVSLKTFETIQLMTLGGPANSTKTLVYYVYEYGFSFYKIGYASALGVVLMILIGVLTILYFKVLSKKVYYR